MSEKSMHKKMFSNEMPSVETIKAMMKDMGLSEMSFEVKDKNGHIDTIKVETAGVNEKGDAFEDGDPEANYYVNGEQVTVGKFKEITKKLFKEALKQTAREVPRVAREYKNSMEKYTIVR